MEKHSQKFLQQRRLYMMLPVLVLPFVSIIFWILGGGQGISLQAQQIHSGLNLKLPGAHFDKNDNDWNKFTLYEEARRDSIRYEQARKSDPYFVVTTLQSRSDTVPGNSNKFNASLGDKQKSGQLEDQEQLINQKLQELTRQLNQPEATAGNQPIPAAKVVSSLPEPEEDIARLEKMMSIMAASDASDPELQQIDGMLDKILDIQHPDRTAQKIREQNEVPKVHTLSMTAAAPDDNITTLQGQEIGGLQESVGDSIFSRELPLSIAANAFYGLDDENQGADKKSTAVEAVIHETQTVTSGATIKMRLSADVYIGDRLIPKDQFIYGTCAIAGERLTVTINAIRIDNMLLPVALQVYDLDGQQGIYIPGAMVGDAARRASSQSVQNMQLYSLDNSLAGQAASASIEAAKGLFSKKVKLLKVTVKAGYQLLLQDSGQLL
jgi:conjugative transposon TraM protein